MSLRYVRKPLGVQVVQWGSVFVGLCLISIAARALFSGTMPLGEFATQGGFVLVAMGALPLIAGVCLWRNLPLARPLVLLQNALVLPFAYLPHGSTNASKLVTVGLIGIFGTVITAWYFYRQRNVRAYFASRAAH